MIERLMLRASDEAAGGGDPYAAVNTELILGPLVRPLSSCDYQWNKFSYSPTTSSSDLFSTYGSTACSLYKWKITIGPTLGSFFFLWLCDFDGLTG